MARSTKSASDSWFHTDHKHGASLQLNKPALLEQSNSTIWEVHCKATEGKNRGIYQARHLDFNGSYFY